MAKAGSAMQEDDFEEVEKIGRGTFGEVFKARAKGGRCGGCHASPSPRDAWLVSVEVGGGEVSFQTPPPGVSGTPPPLLWQVPKISKIPSGNSGGTSKDCLFSSLLSIAFFWRVWCFFLLQNAKKMSNMSNNLKE